MTASSLLVPWVNITEKVSTNSFCCCCCCACVIRFEHEEEIETTKQSFRCRRRGRQNTQSLSGHTMVRMRVAIMWQHTRRGIRAMIRRSATTVAVQSAIIPIHFDQFWMLRHLLDMDWVCGDDEWSTLCYGILNRKSYYVGFWPATGFSYNACLAH